MKIINSLIIASAVLGSTAAFAGDDPVTEYLKQSHLISADTTSAEVVNREPVGNLDPATDYLVESGLIDAPTVRVEGGLAEGPATAISPDVNYWEAPAS